jgi:hypothetical protein
VCVGSWISQISVISSSRIGQRSPLQRTLGTLSTDYIPSLLDPRCSIGALWISTFHPTHWRGRGMLRLRAWLPLRETADSIKSQHRAVGPALPVCRIQRSLDRVNLSWQDIISSPEQSLGPFPITRVSSAHTRQRAGGESVFLDKFWVWTSSIQFSLDEALCLDSRHKCR